MKRYTQFEDLVITDFEVDKWPHPRHNHNHFEIVYIAKGCGRHYLNDIDFCYKKGDLFLLGPDDEHEFKVKQTTRFIYFKFTKLYFNAHTDLPLPGDWNKDIDYLISHPERKTGSLLQFKEDKLMVHQLMEMVVQEYQNTRLLNKKIIFQIFSIVMLILKRNSHACSAKAMDRPASRGVAQDLIEYIELHIYDPAKLTLKAMSAHFNYSDNYIGMLFKEKVGTSLREYVNNFRQQLIRQRLSHGTVAMKQIASEFGFVDESHLYKFIKKNNLR
ncbi:helix-turn-helix domain-containing protein [Fulvivirga sediminis]|uniref:Helix-turn-helix domain-containing protein n=1 Tax=Fulvivirga sediminis TaxID=2803949 RepID=A0A937F6E9_9BACT|nr:AraC family transcriptional regulator [Fulvivirga sediminis]MBL3655170.1 helix-turn-helix domain-containing protein [Fulvivirga sediminis]